MTAKQPMSTARYHGSTLAILVPILDLRARLRRPFAGRSTTWPDPAALDHTTFSSPEHDQRFRDEGYVVVDLLSDQVVTNLRDVCSRHHPPHGAVWESDFFATDRQVKEEVHRAITTAFSEGLAGVLTGHRPVIANFVVSRPGPGGGIDLHHHSSLVDERRFRAVAIWCALQDTTEDHGTLHVVGGSHRVPRGPKAERGPEWFTDRRSRLMATSLRSVPLRAGQAIVFDNALLHCSFPNTTNQPRMSAVALYVPTAAQARYYEYRDDGACDYYALDPSFFFETVAGDHEWAKPDHLRHLGTEAADSAVYTDADVDRFLLPGDCLHPS